MYSENTIRKKAKDAGYYVTKGFQHYLGNKNYPVWTYANGERVIGYNVEDLSLGCLVWGCYNNVIDHLWSLEDVDIFLREEYTRYGLEY